MSYPTIGRDYSRQERTFRTAREAFGSDFTPEQSDRFVGRGLIVLCVLTVALLALNII